MQLRATICGVLIAGSLLAAETRQQALDRATGLKGRFTQFQSAAASTYAVAGLGAAICRYDPDAGSGFLRDAIRSLNTLPDQAFFDSGRLLPVTSFGALVSFVVGAAKKCDGNLGIHLAADRVRERVELERLRVKEYLDQGAQAATRNPDRAAQLLSAAIGVGDPDRFPFESFIRAAAQLRRSAPELGDEVFEAGLELAGESKLFRIPQLAQAGEYLFTSLEYVESPDEELRKEVRSVGGIGISVWSENRRTANPDPVEAYLKAVKRALEDGAAALHPAQAYAIAHQVLSRVRDLLPADEEPFRKYLAELAGVATSHAAEIHATFSGGEAPAALELSRDYKRDVVIQRFRDEWLAGRLEEAKNTQRSVDDGLALRQLSGLVTWAEVLRALRQKDLGLATSIANGLPAGPKRALLYCAIAAANRDSAIDYLKLAWREVDGFPAEQRAYVLTPIAALMLVTDPDMGYAVLHQLVKAYNEAAISPRRALFDPGRLRRSFQVSRNAAPDPNLLMRPGRMPMEVLDSGRRRHGFSLQMAGVTFFDLQAVLAYVAKSCDGERLESILLDLREEARQSAALIALAAARIQAAQ